MRYTVILTDEVKAKLHALPLLLRREIGHRLFLLEDDLTGNVKKLRGSWQEYRLRVGGYRALLNSKDRLSPCMLCGLVKIFTDEHYHREENSI